MGSGGSRGSGGSGARHANAGGPETGSPEAQSRTQGPWKHGSRTPRPWSRGFRTQAPRRQTPGKQRRRRLGSRVYGTRPVRVRWAAPSQPSGRRPVAPRPPGVRLRPHLLTGVRRRLHRSPDCRPHPRRLSRVRPHPHRCRPDRCHRPPHPPDLGPRRPPPRLADETPEFDRGGSLTTRPERHGTGPIAAPCALSVRYGRCTNATRLVPAAAGRAVIPSACHGAPMSDASTRAGSRSGADADANTGTPPASPTPPRGPAAAPDTVRPDADGPRGADMPAVGDPGNFELPDPFAAPAPAPQQQPVADGSGAAATGDDGSASGNGSG